MSLNLLLGKILRFTGYRFLWLANKVSHFKKATAEEDWLKVFGDKTLRLNYDLNESSIVFDLGGYEGQWASDIFSKYLCNVYVFEPVPYFASKIKERFIQNKKISVWDFGLAGENLKTVLALDNDGSSIFKNGKDNIDIELRKFDDFVKEQGIPEIDLIKINIEGSEYELLDDLLANGYVKNIKNIQIQFHEFVPEARKRMQAIQVSLGKTHSLTYQYNFIWENWKRRD
jgi:FkbM family methyltransferase